MIIKDAAFLSCSEKERIVNQWFTLQLNILSNDSWSKSSIDNFVADTNMLFLELYVEDFFDFTKENFKAISCSDLFLKNLSKIKLSKKTIVSKKIILFLSTRNSQVPLGFAILTTSFAEVELLQIGIIQEERSKGLASFLLSFIIFFLKNNNFTQLILEVRVSNYSAIKLYKKLDFSPLVERKNFYANPQENAYTLVKKL